MRRNGFTLIELLVVIAIIGILASIVLVSLNTARSKGRDAKRISDIKAVETAMEMYVDSTGSYPLASGQVENGGYLLSTEASLLAPYLPSTPSDPLWGGNPSYDYEYVRGNNGQAYGLLVHVENQMQSPDGRTITAGGDCVTGSSVNPGWWGGPPACPF